MLHLSFLRWSLGLLATALPLLLAAQLDYALDIPDIAGDVTQSDFVGQIEITSFSYGVEAELDGPRTAGSVSQGCFLLGKSVDRASPLLFAAVTTRRSFPEITLTAYRYNDGNLSLPIVYTFRNVHITKWETGAEGESGIDEVIGIVAEEVEIEYTIYDETGAREGIITTSYNFAVPE